MSASLISLREHGAPSVPELLRHDLPGAVSLRRLEPRQPGCREWRGDVHSEEAQQHQRRCRITLIQTR